MDEGCLPASRPVSGSNSRTLLSVGAARRCEWPRAAGRSGSGERSVARPVPGTVKVGATCGFAADRSHISSRTRRPAVGDVTIASLTTTTFCALLRRANRIVNVFGVRGSKR